jgi:hypothetical protein
MAFIQSTPLPLKVRVTNVLFDKTVVGQVAEVVGFHFTRDYPNTSCQVNVDLIVTPYSILENNELGQAATSRVFRTYSAVMNAADDTLVNDRTGEVLLVYKELVAKGEIKSETDWQAAIQKKSEEVEAASQDDTRLQGAWFEQLCATQSVRIYPLLEQFIVNADKIGFFLR